jgi:hypothetical protein
VVEGDTADQVVVGHDEHAADVEEHRFDHGARG